MKQLSTNSGIAKSSIKSVTKSSMPDGKVSGIKSNNGIENSVSGVEGKEKSEAILEAMFEFGIQHAQEFAQRDLDEDMRWWQRMNQRTMVETASAAQKSQAAQGMAGLASGLGAIGGGLAAAGLNKLSQSKEEEGQGKNDLQNQKDMRGLAQNETKDIKKFSDNPHQEQMMSPEQMNQENFQGEQMMLTQNESESWESQDFETIDATDPEEMFG